MPGWLIFLTSIYLGGPVVIFILSNYILFPAGVSLVRFCRIRHLYPPQHMSLIKQIRKPSPPPISSISIPNLIFLSFPLVRIRLVHIPIFHLSRSQTFSRQLVTSNSTIQAYPVLFATIPHLYKLAHFAHPSSPNKGSPSHCAFESSLVILIRFFYISQFRFLIISHNHITWFFPCSLFVGAKYKFNRSLVLFLFQLERRIDLAFLHLSRTAIVIVELQVNECPSMAPFTGYINIICFFQFRHNSPPVVFYW